jgi:uncharacterized oligopeptide transporter (OPT) family protein
MSTVINGMLNQSLPWGLVIIGFLITVVVELCGVRGLPFAVGVYLPLYTPVPIFFGGLVRMLIDRRNKKKEAKASIAEAESSPGILYSSGLVAGGALAGLLGVILVGLFRLEQLEQIGPSLLGDIASSDLVAVVIFAGLTLLLWRAARGTRTAEKG